MQLTPSYQTPWEFDAAVRQYELTTEQKISQLRQRVKTLENVLNLSDNGHRLNLNLSLVKRVRVNPISPNNPQDWRLNKPEELRQLLANHNQVLVMKDECGVFFTAETQLGECGPKDVEISSSLLSAITNFSNPSAVSGKMWVYRECIDFSQTLYHVLDPVLTFCAAVELNALSYSKEELETLKRVIFETIERTNHFTICFEWNGERIEFRQLNYYQFKILAAAWTKTPCSILATIPLQHYNFLLNAVTYVHRDQIIYFLPIDRFILICLHPDNFKTDLFLIHSFWSLFIIPAFAAQSVNVYRQNSTDVARFFETLDHLHKQHYVLNFISLHHAFIELLPLYLAAHKKMPPITLQHIKSNYMLQDVWYQRKLPRQLPLTYPQYTQFKYGDPIKVADEKQLLKEAVEEFQQEAAETEKKLAALGILVAQLEQRHLKPSNTFPDTMIGKKV